MTDIAEPVTIATIAGRTFTISDTNRLPFKRHRALHREAVRAGLPTLSLPDGVSIEDVSRHSLALVSLNGNPALMAALVLDPEDGPWSLEKAQEIADVLDTATTEDDLATIDTLLAHALTVVARDGYLRFPRVVIAAAPEPAVP